MSGSARDLRQRDAHVSCCHWNSVFNTKRGEMCYPQAEYKCCISPRPFSLINSCFVLSPDAEMRASSQGSDSTLRHVRYVQLWRLGWPADRVVVEVGPSSAARQQACQSVGVERGRIVVVVVGVERAHWAEAGRKRSRRCWTTQEGLEA